jgi:hypothetical protein
LVILCGFPTDIANVIRNTLERDRAFKYGTGGTFSYFDVIPIPSPSTGGYTKATIAEALAAAAGRVTRQRSPKETARNTDRVFVPRQLVLAFVPGPGDGELTAAFGVSAHLLPLEDPAVAWWRDGSRAVNVVSFVASNRLRNLPSTEVGQAVLNQPRKSPVALPSRNFFLERDTPLKETLDEIARDRVPLNSIKDKVRLSRKRDGTKGPVDARGRYFLVDQSSHAPSRFVESSSSPEERTKLHRIKLEGLYRLGFPLPEGFHHDVTRDGSSLQNEQFTCAREGGLTVSGTHANVYPNDFVRLP